MFFTSYATAFAADQQKSKDTRMLKHMQPKMVLPESIWRLTYQYTFCLQYRAYKQGKYDPSVGNVIGGVLTKWLVEHEQDITAEFAASVPDFERTFAQVFANRTPPHRAVRRGRFNTAVFRQTEQLSRIQCLVHTIASWERAAPLCGPAGLTRKVRLPGKRVTAEYAEQKQELLQFIGYRAGGIEQSRCRVLLRRVLNTAKPIVSGIPSSSQPRRRARRRGRVRVR